MSGGHDRAQEYQRNAKEEEIRKVEEDDVEERQREAEEDEIQRVEKETERK